MIEIITIFTEKLDWFVSKYLCYPANTKIHEQYSIAIASSENRYDKRAYKKPRKYRSEGTAILSGAEQESLDLLFTVPCFPTLLDLMMSLQSAVFAEFR